jgi:hypothetical protein
LLHLSSFLQSNVVLIHVEPNPEVGRQSSIRTHNYSLTHKQIHIHI